MEPGGGVRSAIGLLLTGCLLMAACGGSSKQNTDGGQDGSTGDPCQPGQTRCDRQSYQDCIDGLFAETTRCTDPEVCAQDLGCVDCNPGLATVCVGDEVHACQADATIGALVERCPTGCAHGTCEGGAAPPRS